MALIQSSVSFQKVLTSVRRDRHTQRMPYAHDGRDWSDELLSQGTSKIAGAPLEARQETRDRLSYHPQKAPTPEDTLILDF